MSALNGSLQTMCAAATALDTFTRNATSGGRKRRCFDVHSSRDFHAPISVGLCGALNSPIAGAAGQDVSHAMKEKPESILAQISQETLAEMIGTTRSRVSFFLNKFRKLGFIDYNGVIEVHSSLLNVVLHDEPHIEI
jgi:hypothetical protein